MADGHIGVGGGEGSEVVLTDDERCGLFHCVDVEGPVEGVNKTADPRRADFGAKDAIFIGFCADAVAGMEGGVGVLGAEDADGWREGAVERAEKVRWWNGRGQFNRRNLGAGVNSGIGASAALGEGRFSGDALDSGGKFALNGAESGLDLPPVEIGSVVGEREFPIGHCFFTAPFQVS